VMLPDGNGVEIARGLKNDPSLAGVFVVLLSGHKTSGEDQAAGLGTGLADGYIVRPFSKPEFLARVDALLRLRTAQEALREALVEKEALLKETHHRVKNNLAMIVSLMRINAGRSVERETRTVLKEMQDRIHSVILLNETLYKTASYTRVKLADYLKQIATHAFRAQTGRSGHVRLVLDLEPVEAPTAQAIPCGLIVNELMTNSLKHGFPDGSGGGEVRVSLRSLPEGQVRLCVTDTGAGLPQDFEARRGKSLGLQLVGDLTRQLQGTLEVGPGASFTVTFRPAAGVSPARP
jgi:two-component sensor histidine kinase